MQYFEQSRQVDLDYPNLDTAQIDPAPMSIKTIRYDKSGGSVPQQFTFSGEMEVTNTSTWSLTTSVTLGISVEVSAGFLVLSAKTTSLEVSVSGTYESSMTTRTTESFNFSLNVPNFPLNVPAGKILRATATLYEANISTTYTATMAFTLDTSKEIKFVVEGMYSGIDSD